MAEIHILQPGPNVADTTPGDPLPADTRAVMNALDTLHALWLMVNQAGAVAYAAGVLLPEGAPTRTLGDCTVQLERASALADAVGELLGIAKTQIDLVEQQLLVAVKGKLLALAPQG